MTEKIRFSIDIDSALEKKLDELSKKERRDRKSQAEVILESYLEKLVITS